MTVTEYKSDSKALVTADLIPKFNISSFSNGNSKDQSRVSYP